MVWWEWGRASPKVAGSSASITGVRAAQVPAVTMAYIRRPRSPTRRSKRGHSRWIAGGSSRVRSSITLTSAFSARAGRETVEEEGVDVGELGYPLVQGACAVASRFDAQEDGQAG
jgi:hypothetical protein